MVSVKVYISSIFITTIKFIPMANLPGQLPTSGEITMNEIYDGSYVSPSSTNQSIEAAYENLAYSPAVDISMESWRTANTGYYSNDGVNDYIRGAWSRGSSYTLVNNDWSIVCWVRMKSTTKKNQNIWDFNTSTFPNNNNRIFLQYNSGFNRFIARVRTNATNFDRQWALHDNSGVTGITSSGTGWVTSQRGNVNSENWCMLTVTYDASQTNASNAFKMYWNASELTNQAVANSNTRTNNTMASLSLCDANSGAPTAGNANIDMDEWKYFEAVLSSASVSSLYNSGVIRNNAAFSPITVTQTQVSFDLDSDGAKDTSTYWTPSITGGARNIHQDATALNL